MRWALALVALIGVTTLAAAVAGCGGHPSKKTSLTLVADNGFGSKAVFHLRCDPPGGDIAHPARVCAALKKRPDVLLHPRPFQCLATSWDIAISGRFEGRAVNVKTKSCWTPQMELIDRLGIASELVTHLVSFGVARDELARTVEIPANAPVWLIATGGIAGGLSSGRPTRQDTDQTGTRRCDRARGRQARAGARGDDRRRQPAGLSGVNTEPRVRR